MRGGAGLAVVEELEAEPGMRTAGEPMVQTTSGYARELDLSVIKRLLSRGVAFTGVHFDF